jgi:hypothetical protein
VGRGYLGIADDRSKADFEQAMAQPRRMYSTPEAQRAIIEAVRLCAKKKSRGSADILLIEGPQRWLRKNRWLELQPLLSRLVEDLPYTKVFMGIEEVDGDFILTLKDEDLRPSSSDRRLQS